MAYRYRFYPPEIDDWDYDYGDERQIMYSCGPACCPNPNCYPYSCVPSTNYATCCPNPNSIYNTSQYVSTCSPECRPTCNPRASGYYCNPGGCYPNGGQQHCRPNRRW